MLATLKARDFQPVSMDDVPNLFSEAHAAEITTHGTPVIAEWSERSGICKIGFLAGQAYWLDQVASVRVECQGGTRDEAFGRILVKVGIISAEIRKDSEFLQRRGFYRREIGSSWSGLGVGVGIDVAERPSRWVASLVISYKMPSAQR